MAVKIKRRRAQSPGKWSSPYGPNTLAHVGFAESRHLQPERLPSGKRERAVCVRLLDASKQTIFHVQKLSTTIKRLVASNLQLTSLSEDLMGRLFNLTKLDLSNNKLKDSSFPDCMRKLEQLVDVRLAGNTLTKVPQCIKHMKHLTRLDMSDNQIDSGQGLDHLTRLRILVLDNNKLTSVFKEISELRRLEVLRCCRNKLREIPRDVRHLKSLTDLAVSDNHISVLPADVFLLPKLDVFVASKNEVINVPSFTLRPGNKRWITHIDLSDNRLIKFPGHLLLMTSKLDLSNNKIKSMPYHVTKKLDIKADQELLIKDNPLCYPPSDVCESGLKSILSFFRESESEVKVYQGLKVFILGHHRSGKTSFIQSMLDQQPRMSEDIQDSSGGVDIYDMTLDLEEEDAREGRPGKSLELSIWDFCGHPFYMFPHYVFFEHPALTVLTFNMADYSEHSFEEQIWCWFTWMIAKTNKAVVVLVGTQCDKLSKSQISKVRRDVKAKLSEHLDEQAELLRQRIRAIEERPSISPTLSEQLKAYMRLLQTRVIVKTEVLTTSSKMYLGFDQVRQAIKSVSGNQQLFPNVMKAVPTFWLDVRYYIEDRGNTMSFPAMTWQAFEEEVTSRFGMKHLMKSIAQYLHETGQSNPTKTVLSYFTETLWLRRNAQVVFDAGFQGIVTDEILWFSNVETLKDLVFIRPSWLFDVFRSTFRHDLEDSVFSPDDRQRSAGLTTMKFERLRREALSQAVLDRDLLTCLLATFIPPDLAPLTTQITELFAEKFEMGYSLTKREADALCKTVPYKDAAETGKATKIFIPWLRKNTEPEDFTKDWESSKTNRKLVCYFKFPLYLPPGLFEITTVRAHNERYKLSFKHQWGGGIHAVHMEENVHVVLTYFLKDDECSDDKSMVVKYEVRSGSSDKDEQIAPSTLWSVQLPLLLDFEKLLGTYTGVVVERLTQCPICGKPSFLGEWLTPRETQLLATRLCEACGQEVDTAYLVQPREQKKVIIKRKTSPPPQSIPPLSPLPDPELPNTEKEEVDGNGTNMASAETSGKAL